MAVDSLNTKKELIQYLLSKVKDRELKPELAKRFIKELSSQPKHKLGPMALVGIACRYPEAENADQFWDNLAVGHQSIGPFPAKRLEDFKRIKHITGPLRRGGFFESVAEFDSEYFNLPPRVVQHMDPYHRLMLEVFIEAIEDAGYHRGQLQGRSIGIFVGNDHTHRLDNSYLPFIADPDFTTLTGSWTGVLASRLSYLLNFNGPAVVLDTGCSSTLIALDYAIKAIDQGDCEAALVGSANIFFDPVNFDNGTQSKDYIVRAFDQEANGTVWSEGIGAVYIKPLSKALADGDHVYGVIRGIATNNDGKSNGLTAPSAKAQQEVLERAWERAGISPETISYIEAHGTGTTLGDPIEIRGLTGAFSKYTNKRQFCAIGSIKSNIGHTVGNAGMASLIKVLLCLREQALPPSINFSVPNPFIDFCTSPVYVQDRLTPWIPENIPRRAGISAFSLSGTNCHVVIEEAPSNDRGELGEALGIFPISGRSLELLRKTVLRHLKHIKRHQKSQLRDLSFTACTGREHHPLRAMVLCTRIQGLAAGLEALSEILSSENENTMGINSVYEEEDFCLLVNTKPSLTMADQANVNEVKRLTKMLAMPEMNENLFAWRELAEWYVQGYEVDFHRIFVGRDVKRVSIPPQVFDSRRHWDETPRELTHRNSDFDELQESSVPEAKTLWAEACAAGSRLPKGYGPSTPTETLLAWIWSEVLGYPVINPTDDFYALGGDSINGLKIIQVLNGAFGLELPPSSLLGSPVFKDFVHKVCNDFGFNEALLDSRDEAASGAEALETLQGEIVLPLSPAQSRIFLSVNMMPDSIAYNVTGVSRLTKKEDITKIESLVRLLIDRHESLRTSFCIENGKPMQIIHPHAAFAIERKVLKYEADEGLRMKVLKSELRSFVRPFDLEKAPLMRVGYFQFENQEAYMAVDFHHIITDGTSMGLFFAEYKALEEGLKLAPLSLKYRDALAWFQARQSEPAMRQQRQWWVGQFSDGIPVLEIQTDRPRPAVRDYRGARVFHRISTDLVYQLKEVAKASGTTLFTVMLAAFHNFLARLGGGRDIVIGTPVAGRPRFEFQPIVGMFVNTLPIRTRSVSEESFLEFLFRTKNTVMQAFDNQEYAYEALIEDLKPQRNPGRNPLFDVYFALQNVDMGLSDPDELILFDSGTAKFDLTVSARETPEGLLMEWEYAVALFNRSSIERMVRYFEKMLASIVKNQKTALGDLQMMEEKERLLIVEELNKTTFPYPKDQGIPGLFEDWVRLRGNEKALILDGNHLTYQELNAWANRIARKIISRGVMPGSGVALLLHRSFEMIASILGVLKAGCHYIPMDAENPWTRLVGMMKDGGAKLLLTHQGLQKQVGDTGTDGIPIMDLDSLDSQLPDHNLEIKSNLGDTAYIMYTSGSTGMPKGIRIRQESVIRVVRNAGYIEILPQDVLLQLSNYSFDGSVFDIFGALLNGASLVLLHRQEVTDPRALGSLISDNGVSVFFITTALFNALVDSRPECLDGTRKVLFGGEMVSVQHVRQAYQRLGPGRLVHVYGPTESTVFATAYPIDEYPKEEGVPIGRAIGNTTLYVLDERLRIQPVGVPGELYIGGKGLAEGYLNQPELTKERFIKSPFQSDEFLYRTGDLVVWEEGLFLRFLGRRDHQVKLRGYRIELGEIETVANKIKTIKNAHVGLHIDGQGMKSLCLWVVPHGEPAAFNTEALHQELTAMLPSYMVPAFILPLAQLPLNKNGKVDKAQLPGPLSIVKDKKSLPRNEREEQLAEVWAEVLGINQIGIDDNFFALGGDSIKAIQVVSRIQNRGFTVAMADFFQYQTIEALAPQLREDIRAEAEQGIVLGDCQPNPILSWYLSKKISPDIRFTQAMLIKAGNGKWQNAELQAALDRLCLHHDALRLRVASNGSLYLSNPEEGRMYYLSEESLNIRELSWEEGLIKLQQYINPQEGPLVVGVLVEDNEGVRLFLAIHHLAVDVVSWGVLIEDLMASLMDPRKALPKKTTSFSHWTQAVTEWAQAGGARDELPYWRSLAQEAQALPAPFTPVSIIRQDTDISAHVIDGETGALLCGKANAAYHTEVFHLVLTVLSRGLCKWIKSPAILINLEGHGREEFDQGLDVSRTVGWFTSTYPVLLKAGGEVGAAIVAVKEAVRGTPRKGFGFGVLQWLDKELDTEDKALLDRLVSSISFNYLGMQGEHGSGDISISALPAEVTVDEEWKSNWVLDIVASQVGLSLVMEIRYPATLFLEEEMEHLMVHLTEAAREIAIHCSEKAGEKTASDFTAVKLQQGELEDILDDLLID